MPQLPPPVTTPAPKPAPKKKAPAKKAAAPKKQPNAKHLSAAQVVSAVAHEFGIPPAVALAIATHESGLDPHIVGDQGTSFGLFQLHEGGELGNHNASWAFNPYNNARTALSIVASVHAQHPNMSWGEIAAAAQRPADPAGYAAAVNGLLAGYHASGQPNAVHYFVSQAPAGGGGSYALTGSKASKPGDYLGKVASEYGYLSAYLGDPEIGPILRQAAAGGWSENRLLTALEKTNWWKKTSQTAREMGALQKTDPATYKQQWQQQRQQIGALATSMGLSVGDHRLDQLATTALWSGWNPAQIQQAVGAEFHYDPKAEYTGTAGADIQKFKNMAGEYLVPMDNHTLGKWTKQALQGKINPDDYSGYLAEQAKTLFPWMAHAIDKGVSPMQYLQPYQSAAASTLELDPANVDFQQAKWRKLFETVDDKGQRTERGLANAMTMMRTDPVYGYDQTKGAQQEAASLAQQIATSFGFAA